ncbi:hypothetical protein [Mycolicibacterium fortuitum]|uniref:hypothetical protein n=1 Tax=Mycolicibacterium fortuitum TaxID=1766 RepID=UPI001C105DBB
MHTVIRRYLPGWHIAADGPMWMYPPAEAGQAWKVAEHRVLPSAYGPSDPVSLPRNPYPEHLGEHPCGMN